MVTSDKKENDAIVSKAFVTYMILDPRDDTPIYVGQTSNFKNRMAAHKRNAMRSAPKIKSINIKVYLSKLKALGFEPVFKALEYPDNESEALISETKWVEKLTSLNYPLLNSWKEHKQIIHGKYTREYVHKHFESKLEDAKDES